MLTKEQEKQILDAVEKAYKLFNINYAILVAIRKYDKIVNPPVVDDTDWDEVIKRLEHVFEDLHPLDWQEAKAIIKAIDFIKSHTKKG